MAVEARDIYVMKLKYFRDRGSWVFFFLIWLYVFFHQKRKNFFSFKKHPIGFQF